jgi:S-adenosyl methyltransferase
MPADGSYPGATPRSWRAAPGPMPRPAPAMREAVALYERMAAPITVRAPDQVMALMTGFDLVEPGLAPVDAWYAPGHRRPPRRTSFGGQGVAGVGRRGDVLAPPGPGCAGDIEGPGTVQEPG